MDKKCPICSEWVEDSRFCTNCGTEFAAVAPDIGAGASVVEARAAVADSSPRPATATSDPDGSAVASSGTGRRVLDGIEKTGNAVGNVAVFIFGLGWGLLGLVVLIASIAGGSFGGALVGLLVIAYGIYLMKPGGWKFVIY